VTIHVNAQTTAISGDGQKVDGLVYKDRASGTEHRVDLAGVFVQIGLVPNTEFLKGALELSRYGEILIDERCATSVPGVYAAGDATTVPYKQIVIAAGEGAKAALSAFDHLIRAPAPAAGTGSGSGLSAGGSGARRHCHSPSALYSSSAAQMKPKPTSRVLSKGSS
jgi:NADH-dependent peroxiredoxin subunit F